MLKETEAHFLTEILAEAALALRKIEIIPSDLICTGQERQQELLHLAEDSKPDYLLRFSK